MILIYCENSSYSLKVHLRASCPAWHCQVGHVLSFSCIRLPVLLNLMCLAGVLRNKGFQILKGHLAWPPQCGLPSFCSFSQRWSRGHKARGQGQGHKINPRPRPRTAFPRTDTLEAKDRNARGQGQGPTTQAQVLSKKKRSSQKFFKRSPQKNVFQKIFQALHRILTIQKIVLSSSRGQANFRGLEASRPRLRPRTSKRVLEDSTSGFSL